MAAVLSVESISKTYIFHPVLNQVSFIVNAGQRVGLVGANGAGKSTLLKIIAGLVEPDSGTVAVAEGVQLGYLPQAISGYEDKRVADLIEDAVRDLRDIERQMRALEQAMTTAQGDALASALAAYGEASEQFERRGGYDLDYRIEQVLSGLQVAHLERERAFATLSGGEKARIGLAMLLLQAPDVLLLDEPTNHLDAASLTWLEAYLTGYRGAMVIVSHDRYFLNQTVETIVELDEHSRRAKVYAGNYDQYRQAKLLERRQWEQDYRRQQEAIKTLRLEIKEGAHRNSNYRTHRDNDKFVVKGKRATHDRTVSRRVQAAEEKLKRIEANLIPEPPDNLRFAPDFDPRALKGRAPLYVSGLSKAYGDTVVLRDVSFTVGPRSRIVLVGPNGAGKTTLLNLLAGLETPDSGEIMVNGAVRIGLLDQEARLLDGEKTVVEAYGEGLAGTPQQWKAQLLKSGLFRYADLELRVRDLSNGQRRKLQIARMIGQGANLLLLDEPTNDLSFDVLEALEAALADFPGPVIAVSHDRRFRERFGGEVWAVGDGRVERVADAVPA